jgi:uncharacterized membrane protein HdeD (DUF308 family)
MRSMFGRSWWGLVLRGLLSIIFGIAVFVMPNTSLLALITLFGAFAFVDGVLALINAFKTGTGNKRFWALLLEGLVGIAIGIITLVNPSLTAVSLLYVIAAWAVITGVLEIITAIRYADEMEHEWLLGLGGLISVILGVMLALNPAAGIMAVLWMIGAYAIVFGALLIVAGLRARGAADTTRTAAA